MTDERKLELGVFFAALVFAIGIASVASYAVMVEMLEIAQ